MAGPISPGPVNRYSLYVEQTERAAWRKEMLSRVLEKVREVSPTIKPVHQTGQSAAKGRFLDLYV